MNKYVCKHCGEIVAKESDIYVDEAMWFHLRDNHLKELQNQMNKPLKDLFNDNFEKRRD